MPEMLKPDQFEVLANPWVPGMEVVLGFGFDPDKCKIEVDDEGALTITQEGYNCFHACAPDFWRRV
jgi:hypothetical protein